MDKLKRIKGSDVKIKVDANIHDYSKMEEKKMTLQEEIKKRRTLLLFPIRTQGKTTITEASCSTLGARFVRLGQSRGKDRKLCQVRLDGY